MAQADLPIATELLAFRVPMMSDHPALLMTNNMMQASRVRDAILQMLHKRKVRRQRDYRIMVDFAPMPDRDTPVYGYNLRVFHARVALGNLGKPILSIWAETRDQLVSDKNMLLLLMLYNS